MGVKKVQAWFGLGKTRIISPRCLSPIPVVLHTDLYNEAGRVTTLEYGDKVKPVGPAATALFPLGGRVKEQRSGSYPNRGKPGRFDPTGMMMLEVYPPWMAAGTILSTYSYLLVHATRTCCLLLFVEYKLV
jgi:hypothetical protein